MMGSGMPNSHSNIPLPMLILSHNHHDNTDAQRFDAGDGSAIRVDEGLDRVIRGDWLSLSSNPKRTDTASASGSV